MANPNPAPPAGQRHPSPHLGTLAIVFTLLFCAGLYPVTYFGGRPSFSLPFASPESVLAFLAQRHDAALLCAFLHFGSTFPLGIFTATIVSRLEFFGVRAAGTRIALFGGFTTAILTMASSAILWTMTIPAVAENGPLASALRFLNFVLGGPGYSVPFALLMAGVSVPLLFRRLVPRWIPHFRSRSGRHRCPLLVQLRISPGHGADSAHPLPGLHLDDRRRLCVAFAPSRACSPGGTLMKGWGERDTIRLLHLVLSIPILGFLYGPVEHIPQAA